MKTHTVQGKLQALVYDDILPPRKKVPGSDARSVGSRACLALRYLSPSRMILHLDLQRYHLLFPCSFIKVWRAGSLDSRVVCYVTVMSLWSQDRPLTEKLYGDAAARRRRRGGSICERRGCFHLTAVTEAVGRRTRQCP